MKELIKSIISAPAFWGIIIPALVAIFTFFRTEKNKLKWEQYKRKEESYTTLIKALKGFYTQTENKELKDKFLEQLNLCWLYAPDEVIQKGYDFLMSVHTTQKSLESEKEIALGNFVAAIRKDMLHQKIVKKTKLTGKDYKHLRST